MGKFPTFMRRFPTFHEQVSLGVILAHPGATWIFPEVELAFKDICYIITIYAYILYPFI